MSRGREAAGAERPPAPCRLPREPTARGITVAAAVLGKGLVVALQGRIPSGFVGIPYRLRQALP
ncbi:MAG: hypothetical protein AW07_04507 [Candidatus Accumulibacter sp. SK-11]|nr:MAG: hypothetical protein AW07_04507 [Candidatus Accumulibacter sp. SK-11]